MPQHQGPFTPSYKFAKIATRDKYLDMVDNYPPMFMPEILPSTDDLKSKIAFTFTSVQKTGGALFFRHYVDLPKLLYALDQMRFGQPGRQGNPDPEKNGSLYGFPDMKGSPDSSHPEWENTSRVFDIRYMTHIQGQPIRTGPSYQIKFSYSEGRAKIMPDGSKGIVMPVSNGTMKSASILLPIFGNSDMPPLAMLFTHQALNYLQQRESVRLLRMGLGVDALRFYAATDPAAKQRYDAVFESLNGRRKEQAPPTQPMTQQQAQQGYQQLVQDQQTYEQAPYPYGGHEAEASGYPPPAQQYQGR